MRDYYGFSYRPDYGYEVRRNGRLIDRDEKVQYAACFAAVFRLFYDKNQLDFEGTYKLKCRKNFEYQSGNFCALTKPEIHKILRYMRRAFEMKIHFTETDNDYVFVFRVEGKPIKHKFILTFSRVFFEYPYNELAREVLRLRAKGTIDGINYTHKSFLELFHLVTASYSNSIGNGHSLFSYPCLDVPKSRMHEVFSKGTARVNDVFPGSRDAWEKIKFSSMGRNIDWDTPSDARIKKYSDNFKILRKLKQNEKGIRRRARKAV